jgi:hypothetical protein
MSTPGCLKTLRKIFRHFLVTCRRYSYMEVVLGVTLSLTPISTSLDWSSVHPRAHVRVS